MHYRLPPPRGSSRAVNSYLDAHREAARALCRLPGASGWPRVEISPRPTTTICIAPRALAAMGEKTEKEKEKGKGRKKLIRDRMFTGSRSWIPSSGTREVPIDSWSDTID